MLKKLIIGISGVLFVCSCTLFAYRAMEPEAATGYESSYLNAASSAVYSNDIVQEEPIPAAQMDPETENGQENTNAKNPSFS